MAPKKGLGKGLEALFADNATEFAEKSTPQPIKLTEIEPNRNQPRQVFDDASLAELADSIREHGLIQPIAVRPMPNGGYQIVAGERRWRACRMAGLSEAPVIVMDIDDKKAMEIAIIENLQRENLNPIEEAQGFKELMDQYNMTQAEVSSSVGKSRPAIANTLRLLNLPPKTLSLVSNGSLSAGHARALLALENEKLIDETAELAVKQGLNVREIEKLAKKNDKNQKKKPELHLRDSFFDEIEIAMKSELGHKVKVNAKGEKGSIEISFSSKKELSDIAAKLAGK